MTDMNKPNFGRGAEADHLTLVNRMKEGREQLMAELSKVIVGQQEMVEHLLVALFSGGHCLISGVPGLAKTLLIKTLADILQLDFRRIQFTPDLMPSDVVGTELVQEEDGQRRMKFVKGPIFTNILLADEINRTPPKTQSALLEAMEECQVTAAGVTHTMAEPFFVLATQNPIELEGTYPLPEAQLDRFMFKLMIDYLPEDEEIQVVNSTTRVQKVELQHPLTSEDILNFQQLTRQVPAAESVVRYAVRLVSASRPGSEHAPDFIRQWLSWGAGLRASQNLILAGKTRALLQGRYNVAYSDIQALAVPVLRHRLLLNFHAEAERVSVDDVIKRLVETVEVPRS